MDKITGLSGSARVSFDSVLVFVLLTTSFDDCSGEAAAVAADAADAATVAVVVVVVVADVAAVSVVVVVVAAVETDGIPLPRDGQSPTFEKSLAYTWHA